MFGGRSPAVERIIHDLLSAVYFNREGLMKSTIAAMTRALLVFLLTAPPLAQAVGTHVVTNANDSGPGSLRQAIADGYSLIDFDPVFFGSPRTIKLGSALPPIHNNLSIVGPGADLLTLDGQFKSNNGPILALYDDRVTARFEGFTLRGGYDPLSTGDVGGIFSRGKLTLSHLNINDNRGMAVFNQLGTLKIEDSTISNSTAEAIYNQGGPLTITNSTIAFNGAGIFTLGATTISNSTIASNGLHGVVSVTAAFAYPFTVESSIIANHRGNDVDADLITSFKNSLVERSATVITGPGNIVGVDPALGPLGLHGGPTPTLLLLPGSPAIDAGSNPLGRPYDQRGSARVAGVRADVGAVESIPEPAAVSLVPCAAIALGVLVRRSRPSRLPPRGGLAVCA